MANRYARSIFWLLLSLWAANLQAQSADEPLDLQRQTIALIDLAYESAQASEANDSGLARELEAKTQQWQQNLASANQRLSRIDARSLEDFSAADKKIARVLRWAQLVEQELQVVAQIKRKTGKAPARNEALFGRSLPTTHAGAISRSCETAFEMDIGNVAFDALPAQPQWVSVVTDLSGSLLLNTVGSAIETKLSIYASCAAAKANQAVLSSENALGLFAQATLARSTRPQRYFVKIEAEQPGVAQLLVRRAQGQISGKVTLPATVSQNPNQFEVNFYIENQGFLSYAGRGVIVPTGFYSSALPENNYIVSVPSGRVFPSGERLLGKLFRDVECFDLNSVNGLSSICPWSSAQRVQVRDDISSTEINISLTLGASISGRVLGLLPDERAEIRLSTANDLNFSTALVDSVGRYRLTGLPASTFFALVQGNKFVSQIFNNISCGPPAGCNPASGNPIQLVSGARVENIDFRPLRRPSIVGTVSVSPTANFNNTTVQIFTSTGQYVTQVSADSQGQYSAVLEPGSYRVVFIAEQHFREIFNDIPCISGSFPCANISEGLLITLSGEQSFIANATLQPLPRISGKVTDASGNSLASAQVRACNMNDVGCNSPTQTNASGEYRLSGLLPGRYMLLADSQTHIDEVYPNIVCQGPESAPCRPNLVNGQVFEITDNSADFSNIDFVLDRGGAIAGSITPNDSSFFLNGTATVFKEGVTSGVYRDLSIFMSPNQNYRVEDLEPGRYRVIMTEPNNFFSQLYPNINCITCVIASGTLVDVSLAQDTLNINFSPSSLRSISGRASEAGSNNAIAGLAIDFWQRNNFPLLPTLIGSTLTDFDGFYSKGFRQFNDDSLLVSTDSNAAYLNQIHSSISCPLGASAYAGNCAFTGATALAMPAKIPGALDNINFVLQSTAGLLPIFANGFED